MSSSAPIDVATAARQLAALNTDVTSERLLESLRAEAPVHPLLVGFRLGSAAAGAFAAMALLALVAPFTTAELALWIGRLDASMGLPLPAALAVVAVCAAVMAVCSRQLALGRGRLSPLLPDERQIHRRQPLKCVHF